MFLYSDVRFSFVDRFIVAVGKAFACWKPVSRFIFALRAAAVIVIGFAELCSAKERRDMKEGRVFLSGKNYTV